MKKQKIKFEFENGRKMIVKASIGDLLALSSMLWDSIEYSKDRHYDATAKSRQKTALNFSNALDELEREE